MNNSSLQDPHKMNAEEFSIFLKYNLNKEHITTLDLSYLTKNIDDWWINSNQNDPLFQLKSSFTEHFLTLIQPSQLQIFTQLGLNNYHIAGVSIKGIFSIDNPKLALIAHESLSELFSLTDIPYEYEEHKTLYLKDTSLNYKNWGSGYGEITPHSDDLYERLNVDFLSLTTCRDKTKTPTQCYFPRDLLKNFSVSELGSLRTLKAIFKSGKNVDGMITRERNILQYDEKFGFRFYLDFRIDNDSGMRMIAKDSSEQYLLEKMRIALETSQFISTEPTTGAFIILANHKVLHARAVMKLDKNNALKAATESNLYTTPRLLYRSKGPRREYLTI